MTRWGARRLCESFRGCGGDEVWPYIRGLDLLQSSGSLTMRRITIAG